MRSGHNTIVLRRSERKTSVHFRPQMQPTLQKNLSTRQDQLAEHSSVFTETNRVEKIRLGLHESTTS